MRMDPHIDRNHPTRKTPIFSWQTSTVSTHHLRQNSKEFGTGNPETQAPYRRVALRTLWALVADARPLVENLAGGFRNISKNLQTFNRKRDDNRFSIWNSQKCSGIHAKLKLSNLFQLSENLSFCNFCFFHFFCSHVGWNPPGRFKNSAVFPTVSLAAALAFRGVKWVWKKQSSDKHKFYVSSNCVF